MSEQTADTPKGKGKKAAAKGGKRTSGEKVAAKAAKAAAAP